MEGEACLVFQEGARFDVRMVKAHVQLRSPSTPKGGSGGSSVCTAFPSRCLSSSGREAGTPKATRRCPVPRGGVKKPQGHGKGNTSRLKLNWG